MADELQPVAAQNRAVRAWPSIVEGVGGESATEDIPMAERSPARKSFARAGNAVIQANQERHVERRRKNKLRDRFARVVEAAMHNPNKVEHGTHFFDEAHRVLSNSKEWINRSFGHGTHYGITHFGTNSNRAQFMRVAQTANPLQMISIMQRIGFHLPRLIISVTGGAADFELSKELETVIKRGLRKAAEATDAWIVTGGTHCGIMKYVGEAMSEIHASQTLQKKTPVPVIGIATWGIVKKREELSVQGNKVSYACTEPQAIDHNHSCFFLVDDGSENKFGRETALRDAFESTLRTQSYQSPDLTRQVFSGDSSIFSVLLVVEGGPNTLKTVSKATESNTPVVVIEGSGRVADLLAYAWRFLHDDTPESRFYTRSKLRNRIRSTFPKNDVYAMQKELLDVVLVKEKIVIYSLNNDFDIDDAMLRAMLKAVRLHEHTLEGEFRVSKKKLLLTMLFHRADVARVHLKAMRRLALRERGLMQEFKKAAHDALMWSMMTNDPEFVQLMAAQVDDIGKFVTNDTLERLYTHAAAEHFHFLRKAALRADKKNILRKFSRSNLEEYEDPGDAFPTTTAAAADETLEGTPQGKAAGTSRPPIKLHEVDRLIVRLVFRRELPAAIMSRNAALRGSSTRDRNVIAYHELMLWAVLMNHYRLAEFFWQEGGHSIPNALLCSRILQGMAQSPTLMRRGHFVETLEKMKKIARKFEELARGVLDECHREDGEKARKILRISLDQFRVLRKPDGRFLDCIELAVEAENSKFMSHPAAQSTLLHEWYGEMDPSTNTSAIVFNMITMALLRPIFKIKLHTRQSNRNAPKKSQKPGPLYLLKVLFTAPITKFYFDAISFLLLVILYSGLVLSAYSSKVSVLEYVATAWVGVLTIEEGRQLIESGPTLWVSSGWNKLDAIMYCLYFVGFVMRLRAAGSEDDREVQQYKTVQAINLIQFFLRFMRIYAVNHVLGPKLIILSRMAKDLLSFVALFLVFMFAYGIATQAILFPYVELSPQTISNVVYRPYFQIYGELFLDEIEEETDCIGAWPFSSCSATQWLVPFLMAMYLIVVLALTNLLIAMFNRTYEEVEGESLELWRFQFNELLEEYRTKPLLPNPLSIFALLAQACSCAFNACCCACRPGGASDITMNAERAEELEAKVALERFQEKHTERYLDLRKAALQQQDTQRLRRLEDTVEQMSELLVEMHSQSDAQRSMFSGEIQGLRDAIGRGPERMDSVRSMFNPDRHILSSRAKLNHHARKTPLYMRSPDRKRFSVPSAWQSFEAGPEGTILYNVDADLPGTADDKLISVFKAEEHDLGNDPRTKEGKLAERFALANDQVSWDVDVPEYAPLDYTAPYVLVNGPGSTKPGFKWAHPPAFKDVENPGRSAFGDVVVNGVPRNPVGRTGLTGRGQLGKWGPNLADDQIITRWKLNHNGSRVTREGKPVLEFITLRRAADKFWALPGGFQRADGIFPIMRKAFGLTKKTLEANDELKEVEEMLKQNGVTVFKGYMDDPRNTDNAWAETKASNVHDERNILSRFDLVDTKSPAVLDVTWAVAHEDLNLFVDHAELVKLVVEARGAFW